MPFAYFGIASFNYLDRYQRLMCVESGFAINNYYFTIDFQTNQHIFKRSTWFTFFTYLKCRQFTKSGKMSFLLTFFPKVLKNILCFRRKRFCYKDILQIVYLNHKVCITRVYRRIFFQNVLEKSKRERISSQSWLLIFVFCIINVNPKDQLIQMIRPKHVELQN